MRVRIKSRKEEMHQRLEAAEVGLDNFKVLTNFHPKDAMEQELAVLRAKHKAEEEEVKKRCKEKVKALEEEFNAEVEEMKESIRELKVTLSNTEMEEEVMEQTRSELECPVRYCSEQFYQINCSKYFESTT